MSKTVVYTGSTEEQVRWGSNTDPRGLLTEGTTYEIERTEVHSWHTKVKLAGIDGWFNSVSFELVK